MAYSVLATSDTPALIIYLIDVSASMRLSLGGRRRIDVVMEALDAAINEMIFRATKGSIVARRYEIAMLAYSDEVEDLLGGIRGIDEVAELGAPQLDVVRKTETAEAFTEAEQILRDQLPRLVHHPAPLICHLTDGEYTGPDPEPIVQRIKALSVRDGNVLVENIFISDQIVATPIGNPHTWPGISPDTTFVNEYANKLRSMSSVLPETYCTWLNEEGYRVRPGSLMMLPGETPDLVALGFQMSGISGLPTHVST